MKWLWYIETIEMIHAAGIISAQLYHKSRLSNANLHVDISYLPSQYEDVASEKGSQLNLMPVLDERMTGISGQDIGTGLMLDETIARQILRLSGRSNLNHSTVVSPHLTLLCFTC